MSVLDKIESPSDIKKLNIEDLKILSDEIREKIVSVISKNGGHLSSNLGIVESMVALYNSFDFDKDKLIFDVGHQCYAHKILSGRKGQFESIRKDDGISGFPDREESDYDTFTTGHAGTSIAAGLGLCSARDKKNQDYCVISIVGDGSFSNGLNLEALFSSHIKPKNFIVILNDNGMSISKNKNGFYRFVSKSTTKGGYIGSKKAFLKVFRRSFITRFFSKIRTLVKRIFNKNNYFENYGFKYVGIVDGNNIKEMSKILEGVKKVAKEKAVLLHIKTTKGKGYKEAEEQADIYHGVSPNLVSESGTFSLALGKKINELIQKDDKIIAITAGMKDGTGLIEVEKVNPKNFIDVGIAEEYAVTLASGMAAGGLKPIVAIYSTFLQRAYDQIMHDVCLQNLPVIFCIDRAGLVGSDGKTHQGTFDLSYLSHMPNMTILAPNTDKELSDAIDYALSLNSPVAIRYPKNQIDNVPLVPLSQGLYNVIKKGEKANILAVGPNMLSAAKEVAKRIDNIGIISIRAIKPLCQDILMQIKDIPLIVLEENSSIGGLGSLITMFYADKNVRAKILCLGIQDGFIKHGSIKNQLKNVGLDNETITEKISKFID